MVVVPLGIMLIACFATDEDGQGKGARDIITSALFNPFVVASLLGLMTNYIKAGAPLPAVIEMIVEIPAEAFSCCALFLVGHGILEVRLRVRVRVRVKVSQTWDTRGKT